MTETLIQQFASSVMRGMLERAETLSGLRHDLLKGELRELFVSTVLRSFLTAQFDIGSGVVVNQRGEESDQTDIIIYENTILPPLIRAQHLGVYPAECVLATVEIKSWLTRRELLKSEASARKVHEHIYSTEASIYPNDRFPKPRCAVFGFYGTGAKELSAQGRGAQWLDENIKNLTYVALARRYSWIHMLRQGWVRRGADPESCEEIKRFISVLLDNVRTCSQMRLATMARKHRDWLSVYLRTQDVFAPKQA